MIFDTHAHYDDRQFDEDREAVLSSLPGAGIGRVLNAAADMRSVETSLLLAEQYDFIYAAVGVHPEGVQGLTEADLDVLRDRATTHKKVVAIGEIGLDYYWDTVPRDLQKEWFRLQLRLSNELDLPVIVHSRDAAKDTYDILKEEKTGEGAGIVHCFSYSREMARQFLDLGYYIGLGGVVTFKNARAAKEVAAYVPKDRLVLETDCPYMAPVPYRGKRNQSGYLTEVVKAIAEITGESPEALEERTWENGCRIYRLPL